MHNVSAVAVRLNEALARKRVCVAILCIEALCVIELIFLQLVVGGEHFVIVNVLELFGFVNRAVDKRDIACGKTAVQRIGNFNNAFFAHAVGDKVCLRIEQNASFKAIGPIIVVRESAKARFDSAYDYGHVFISMANEVAIYHRSVVGALAYNTAGGEGICLPALFGNGIVVYHGVHIAARNEKAKAGLAENVDAFIVLPVGLGNYADLIAVCSISSFFIAQ